MIRINDIKFILMLFLCGLLHFSCNLKTKNELYMERGLDILDNTINLSNYNFENNLGILKLGVIRNQNLKTRDLIIQLDDPNIEYPYRVHAFHGYLTKNSIHEVWEIEPQVIQINNYNYIIYRLNTSIKHKVDTLMIYKYNDSYKTSDTLILNNLYLNND